MTENPSTIPIPEPPLNWYRRARRFVEANDTRVFLVMNNRFHRRELNTGLRALSKVFNGGWAYVIAVALCLPFKPREAWAALERVAVPIWFTSLLVEGPIKAVFRRRRPFYKIVDVILVGKKPSNWSFPSGHAATAFAGAHLLAREVPVLRWFFYGLAGIVAASRVYLGVHYPSDVLVGSALGVFMARWSSGLWAKMLKRIKKK
jgi:undecaprenyl-diphosphatase